MLKAGAGAPSMIIFMPMVWSVRNIVYSGVLEGLVQKGIQVHLLLRDYDPKMLSNPDFKDFQLASSIQPLIKPRIAHDLKGISFLRESLFSAYSQRNHIASYPIYRRWYARRMTPAQRMRSALFRLSGALMQPKPIYEPLLTRYRTAYAQRYDLEPIKAQLSALKPDLIWSTVNIESEYEVPYAAAAQAVNIPIVTSILSFDNLTSKPLRHDYDHYLVWNQRMRSQLLAFYPKVRAEQVDITGTPQFDFHARPEYRWSRQQTLACLGLPEDARYFLYAASAIALTPEEPQLLAEMARRMQQDPELKSYWLVVRHHPQDTLERWRMLQSYENVVLSSPWSTQPDEHDWTLPVPEDQTRLVSSLLYAEACLNIASTTTLDAAILDKPAIGIRFDHELDAPHDNLYEEYDTTHYKPLVESGGVWVARSWSELLTYLRRAAQTPEYSREERQRMVAQECGIVDGHAAKRVVEALCRLLDHASA